MLKTILALAPILPNEMAILEEKFNVLRLWEVRDPEQLIKDNRNDIIAIVSTFNCRGVSKRLIDALPNLEIISQYGVGFDNIDLVEAKRRDVIVTNTPDVVTDDTADMGLILMLTLARRTVEGDMFLRVGRWHSGAMQMGVSVSGKTVGIVGLGRVGAAIAKRAEAFNTKIIYHGRNKKDDVAYKYYDNLEEMASDSDFLILACAGGEGTKNIIDYKILDALGSKGYLINVSRGSVVNEEDLLIALNNRTIAGAGLDVYADEPNVPEEMIKMDNVVLSPHVGGHTLETKSKMGQLVIGNLLAHFDGQPLLTPVKMAC